MKDERIRKYSLERLSELTNVLERTIRAYITQGLIPRPVGKGRAAYYTEVHLKRLKVIKQLRDRYGLPLDQIRQYLMMAGENEDIQVVPVSMAPQTMVPQAEGGLSGGDDGADDEASERIPYGVDGDEESLEYSDHSVTTGHGFEIRGNSRLEQLVNALQQLVGVSLHARSYRSETCHLIKITPDISLLIKGQYAPQEVVMFEDLANSLRDALTRGLTSPQQMEDE